MHLSPVPDEARPACERVLAVPVDLILPFINSVQESLACFFIFCNKTSSSVGFKAMMIVMFGCCKRLFSGTRQNMYRITAKCQRLGSVSASKATSARHGIPFVSYRHNTTTTVPTSEFRAEMDSFGVLQVPSVKYWGFESAHDRYDSDFMNFLVSSNRQQTCKRHTFVEAVDFNRLAFVRFALIHSHTLTS